MRTVFTAAEVKSAKCRDQNGRPVIQLLLKGASNSALIGLSLDLVHDIQMGFERVQLELAINGQDPAPKPLELEAMVDG